MIKTRFALLRHGVTQWNAEKRIQGRTDISITPETVAWYQKHKLPEDWCQVPWFTSPLSRTRETADALGIGSIAPASPFIEMNWGMWEGEKLPDLRTRLGEQLRENEDRGWDFRPDKGESPRDVLERATAFLRGCDLPSFGVVTHKGVIRSVYAAARGWNMMGKIPDKLDWQCLQVFGWSEMSGLSIEALNVPLISSEPEL
ncbi:histidine phosphatase family protein [Thalassospira sp.]|uniref:histidine phosphatase family protein n=1 Tax=Thalassospira sp. TaxID=1912094 RepID=UPI001B07E1E7|nr:histidine phosphatase family protein [Thalassospira sp.]MBO6807448.1 histidine phosphatase family protein [Thalassospira sp.]MBO6839973.1 histidine phosphatase family protein [Thalassospira sp.]